MLRAIEYVLMGASLLVIVGLVVGGSREAPRSGETMPPASDGDRSKVRESGENT